jgi:prolycopene isomerase
MLSIAERLTPGLRSRAEVIEVSTPLTNVRFTGNLGGSIYGFDQGPGRHTTWRIPNRGPLPGLHFAGAWTVPGGGFEAVMASGELAAGSVLASVRS